MRKLIKGFPAVFFSLVFLSACGYAGDRQVQHSVYETQINSVQEAVDQFQKETGVLPIKNRDMGTPIYQKYPIEFRRLVPKYLPDAPDNAYGNGGVFEYMLVNVEKDPTVKVIDLTVAKVAQKLQRRVDVFRYQNHFGPLDEVIVPYRYTIDYDSLGYDQPPVVKSPFTGQELGFVMGPDVKVHIDYRKDLYAFLREYEGDYETGEDIREILVEHSPFVPVYSFPYTVNKQGEPIFLVKKKK
ncbi:MAG TPA: hypothetical protein VFT51_02775 [Bacillales bacterium]|nr:hypothetical protein [Bacillales bacterium]